MDLKNKILPPRCIHSIICDLPKYSLKKDAIIRLKIPIRKYSNEVIKAGRFRVKEILSKEFIDVESTYRKPKYKVNLVKV